MRSAIVARVRDRNPIEVASDLGHRFWRLLPYGFVLADDAEIDFCMSLVRPPRETPCW
jgi:hypothetical protein